MQFVDRLSHGHTVAYSSLPEILESGPKLLSGLQGQRYVECVAVVKATKA